MFSSFQSSRLKFCTHVSHVLCALHVRPISFFLIYHSNIWCRVQIMEPLITQFSPPSCRFVPLRSQYSLKNSVFSPIKTGKIIAVLRSAMALILSWVFHERSFNIRFNIFYLDSHEPRQVFFSQTLSSSWSDILFQAEQLPTAKYWQN